jgi:hypothetical protein
VKLYAQTVHVVATAYVKANSPQEAHKILESQVYGTVLDADGTDCVQICGLPFNNPHLPAVSLSPAMTIGRKTSDLLELAAENIP